jgi:PIN domain nuclease of toxin-antitoxin system
LKLLLDTHIWVWSLQDPDLLATKVVQALTDAGNELWLSPISVWELLLLAERKRVEIKAPLTAEQWVDEALARVPLHDAPLNRQVATMSREIALHHEDPADRFIAATAAIYDLTLVTADERLLRGTGYRKLANRKQQ